MSERTDRIIKEFIYMPPERMSYDTLNRAYNHMTGAIHAFIVCTPATGEVDALGRARAELNQEIIRRIRGDHEWEGRGTA